MLVPSIKKKILNLFPRSVFPPKTHETHRGVTHVFVCLILCCGLTGVPGSDPPPAVSVMFDTAGSSLIQILTFSPELFSITDTADWSDLSYDLWRNVLTVYLCLCCVGFWDNRGAVVVCLLILIQDRNRGKPPAPLILVMFGRDIQYSHWSSSYNAALSLFQNSRVLKYFHALKGPISGALSVATPAVLCNK